MGTKTAVVLTAGKLVSLGYFLGIGFWASKKLTTTVDEYLLRWDEERMNKIAQEVKEVIG